MNKKITLILTFILLTLILFGCGNSKKDMITNVVEKFYEVSSYDQYESFLNNNDLENYKNNFSPFMTLRGLDDLVKKNEIYYMDKIAYENHFFVEVGEITITNTTTDNSYPQYSYKVDLTFKNESKEVVVKGSGVVVFAKDDEGKMKIDYLKRTDDNAITNGISEFVQG